jgi:hypothetical protein
MRATMAHPASPRAYLPLNGGGRGAKRIGWGSMAKFDPHPDPPPFRGREHALPAALAETNY